MRRSDLEHIIRAAGTISGDNEIVVIGSQSVLGQFPEAPLALLRSAEADVFPANLPEGWKNQLVPICNQNTNGVTGRCLEVHDLAYSKYVAWRPKDTEFTRLLAKFGLTRKTRLVELVNRNFQPGERKQVLIQRIMRDFG